MSQHDVSPYRSVVDFAVLGPLVVLGPDGPIDIAGAKERALLAHLLGKVTRRLSPATDLHRPFSSRQGAARQVDCVVFELLPGLAVRRR